MANPPARWADRLRAGLARTREIFSARLDEVLHRPTADFYDELESTLLQGDVGVATTNAILDRVRARPLGDAPDARRAVLVAVIQELLPPPSPLRLEPPPATVLVLGVNGSGKTTTIGKLAYRLRGENRRVLLAAADTFRAAASEQLTIWGERVGVDVVKHAPGADPAAVVFDSIQAAKARHLDVILVDTAGRLHTKVNLMEELKKINRIVTRELPQAAVERLLVLDASAGQNALVQARVFTDAVELTGLVVAKLDGSAKGGVVLAIGTELGLPVKLIGTGEALDDLQPFDPGLFAQALLAPPARH